MFLRITILNIWQNFLKNSGDSVFKYSFGPTTFDFTRTDYHHGFFSGKFAKFAITSTSIESLYKDRPVLNFFF